MVLNHLGNVILNDSRTSISVPERLHWFPGNMNHSVSYLYVINNVRNSATAYDVYWLNPL